MMPKIYLVPTAIYNVLPSWIALKDPERDACADELTSVPGYTAVRLKPSMESDTDLDPLRELESPLGVIPATGNHITTWHLQEPNLIVGDTSFVLPAERCHLLHPVNIHSRSAHQHSTNQLVAANLRTKHWKSESPAVIADGVINHLVQNREGLVECLNSAGPLYEASVAVLRHDPEYVDELQQGWLHHEGDGVPFVIHCGKVMTRLFCGRTGRMDQKSLEDVATICSHLGLNPERALGISPARMQNLTASRRERLAAALIEDVAPVAAAPRGPRMV